MGDSPAGAELVAVYVTVPDRGAARAVAEALLGAGETRLAACVNIIPGVESMYWWDGAVQTDSELLLMIKTRRELLPALPREVVRVHPYETPEVSLGGGGEGFLHFFWGGFVLNRRPHRCTPQVIGVPIAGGSAPYLKWVRDSTGGGAP